MAIMNTVEKQIKKKLDELHASAMPEDNKKAISEYVQELGVQGYGPSTKMLNIRVLTELGAMTPFRNKDGSEPQGLKRAIIRYFEALKARGAKDSTMMLYKIKIKTFFRKLYGLPKHNYPQGVQWIEIKNIDKNYAGKALISFQDVFAMAKMADNARDAVLPIFMLETGARVNEILSMRMKDLQVVNSRLAYVTLKNSKRRLGEEHRKILISKSVQRLMAWKDLHPRKTESEAPLWANLSYFNANDALSLQGLTHILKKLAKRANIADKPMNPHWYRHSSASFYASEGKYTEAMLRDRFAWVGPSKMPARYVHDSGEAKRFREISGLEPEDKTKPFETPDMLICKCCGTYMGEINGKMPEICQRCNNPWDRAPMVGDDLEAMVKTLQRFPGGDVLGKRIAEKMKSDMAAMMAEVKGHVAEFEQWLERSPDAMKGYWEKKGIEEKAT